MTILSKLKGLLPWNGNENVDGDDADDSDTGTYGKMQRNSSYAQSRYEKLTPVGNEPPFIPTESLPERSDSGVFALKSECYGYKAVADGVMKVKIPTGAGVVTRAGSRKMRTNVMVPIDMPGNKVVARSVMRGEYVYTEGEKNTPTGHLNTDYMKECAPGLHFFSERTDAKGFYNQHGI